MERNTPSEVRSCLAAGFPARVRAWLAAAVFCFGLTTSVRAALQFDVFVGYGGQPTGFDGIVREAGWFPVAVEVQNDGPPFNAVFELSSSQMGVGQTRRILVELPTNTRKRFVIPAFAGSAAYSTWDARLMDERGKVRAEKTGLRPRALAWESILLGATPRTFGGLPKLPELKNNNNRSPMQPLVARLPVEQFPDTPIALESLDAIYLNSEKALELKVNQAAALLAWLHEGGHLIIGVEQPADINATPWLRPLLPCDLSGVGSLKSSREIDQWLGSGETQEFDASRTGQRVGSRRAAIQPAARSPGGVSYPANFLAMDADFAQVEFPVAMGTVRDGEVLLSLQNTPLVVSAKRGRGQITEIMFSPEREPFRSWKNREWFWAKVLSVPLGWFGPENLNAYGGWSVDGVFGAMIDSRQVRKLPVQWLLLLLIVYLLVIGPVDQYCLKRANKQMLTWLTFPVYVALFSLLIYYIGYKLRAGETEWNELHLVDILPHGETAEWRGRTYASVYSPVNARYKVVGEQPQATLRGEFMGSYSGGQEASRAEVLQRDKGFDADIFVPVWTSQLFVSDWMQPGDYPFTATVRPKGSAQGAKWEVTIENRLDHELKEVRLIVRGRVYGLGNLPASRTSTLSVDQQSGTPLRDFVQQNGNQFVMAVQNRQHAFGDNASRWIDLDAAHLTAISFASQIMNVNVAPYQQQRGFVSPVGLDLTPVVERGDAVLLAWDAGHAPADGSMNRFKTVRSHRNSLLRLAVPVDQSRL
ncbi:MAG: hypothetical protein DME23_05240 [Verrucomicrobia bacterium]|nr:MAG: hypothetical protein DME23_05240 [Verrucomicrobiota bacterium]